MCTAPTYGPCCRFCRTTMETTFIDLGCLPLANGFLRREQLNEPELYYPLRLRVCPDCHLVQIEEYRHSPTLFHDDYAYFSSFSSSWLKHAEDYVRTICERMHLGADSAVVEIAANDGYLLQFFKQKGIPCLGVEPCANVADAARDKDIDILQEFFTTSLAEEMTRNGAKPDLIIANNVLAHVPDLKDFVGGLKTLLGEEGKITLEFPHLLRLIDEHQFDTIYHEHSFYFSLHTVKRIFSEFDLEIVDVEELPTHGGSLRIYAMHADRSLPPTNAVFELLAREAAKELDRDDGYTGFQAKADKIKNDLLAFLVKAKSEGKTVCGYGAAAKGNTMLSYAGVRSDLLPFIVDVSPHKQGLFTPGMHIPVTPPEKIAEMRPDYVLILPWNIKDEIMGRHGYIRDWGGRFVVSTPALEIL